MRKIKHKSRPVSKTVDIKDAINRRVTAKNGKELGELQTIYIDPKALTVEGILVKKDRRMFFTEEEYIGKNYIKSITPQGAMLKITPVSEYEEMEVMDARGKKVGVVDKVKRSRKTNSLTGLVVRRKLPLRDLIVEKKYIDRIGKKVILSKEIKL